MKKIIGFVFLTCLTVPSFSQTGTEWMPVWERSLMDSVMNLKYSHPKGYIGSSDWFQFVHAEYKSPIYTVFGTGGARMRLLTENGHFLVFLQIDKNPVFWTKNCVNKFWQENERHNWKKHIRYYSPEEAREKFNADTALSIELPAIKEGYVNHKYPYCVVKMIQKTGRGYVAMYCFYDDEGKKDLAKNLATVEKAFRYGDVPPIKSKLEQAENVTIVAFPQQKKSKITN